MTIEEAEPNPHVLGWIEDSVSLFPSLFLDDPYDSAEINGYNWWDPNQDFAQDLINTSAATSISSTVTTADSIAHADATPGTTATAVNPTVAANHTEESVKQETSKKRKASVDNQDHTQRRNQSPSTTENSGSIDVKPTKPVLVVKRAAGKKRPAVSSGNNSNNGSNKEGRWAEQLLNPCAAAIAANNLNRVQHLLYVLHELASATGDPNHRLAYHGLRALTYHLSSSTSLPSSAPFTFSSAEPRFFQKSILRFNESSPWFAFPSNIVNSSILQVLSEEPNKSRRNLHILDIGVSHGAQWPTLLDSLSHRPGGPPPLVRLTAISPTGDGGDTDTPFSMAPPGYDVSPLLLGFAKTLDINLQINRLNNVPLQGLNPQSVDASPDEILIISAQFRLHHLSHSDRTEFLKSLRALGPKGVILSENNGDCACAGCVDFATGFSRRIEYLWRFLDSTSAAFKGRESEERRMMEGEAARALTSAAEMNEGRERWCERMRDAGFTGEGLGEDAIDGGRALLRKHDGNWEMKVEEDGGSHCCVSLGWKGQPVSFCSLWKLSGGGK